MDDDTFDDINEHSFVADSNDSDNDSNHAHQDPDDMLENNHMIPQAPDGHQSLSQDHDFQSQNQVVLRSRVGPERSLVPDPQPQNVETEESTCSICFEPWTNSGMHRLVSIKCGHLFGESCITKWINQNSGSGPAKCPECNLTTTRRDIRKIWSKHVVVVDAIERNEANARATEEKGQRIRCEQELRLSRLAYERLQSDFADLKKRFERERALKIRYRAEAKQLKMRHPEREIIRHFSYVTTQTAPIPIIAQPLQISRVTQYLSYRQDEEMLVYSRQIGEQHGIAKVSMRDYTNKFHDFIPIHTKPIKDVQCYNGHPGSNRSLVLTASVDKSLKVTSATSKQTVLSYDLEGQVWSCCWSALDSNILFCSVKAKQTSILTLDLRNTKTPINSFSNPGLLGHAPINSMSYIGALSQYHEAIMCGSLEGAFVYNFEPSEHSGTLSGVLSQEMILSGSQGSVTMGGDSLSSSQSMSTASMPVAADKISESRLPVRLHGGTCMSVSFDSASRSWMASYNFIGGKTTQHICGIVDQDPYCGDLLLRSEYKVIGGSPVPWSRNSIFTRLNGSVHMAAGSDSVTHVWYDPRFKSRKALKEEDAKRQLQGSRPISSLDRGPLVQYALQSVNNPPKGILIRDVKPVVISGMDEYIVTLSDKELGMYRWTESQPDIGDDDEDDDEEDSSHTEKEDEADDPVLARKKGKRRRVESENSEIIFLGENIGGSGGGRGGESSIHPGSSRSSSPFFCTQ